MTPTDRFDRDLEDWLKAQAPATAPVRLHDAAIDLARRSRQRAPWLVAVRGGTLGVVLPRLGRSAVRVTYLVVILVLIAAIAAAAIAGGAFRSHPLPLGRNGQIAYSLADGAGAAPFHAFLMHADGSPDREIGQAMCPIFSTDGSVLAYKSGLLSSTELNVAAPDGSSPRIVSGIGDADFALSPDGTRIAWFKSLRPITSPDGNTTVGLKDELWVTPISGGPGVRIVPEADDPSEWYSTPEWSPDGRDIAFASNISQFTADNGQSHRSAIYVVRDDGSNLHAVTRRPGTDQIGISWSPDSRYIAYDGLPDGSAPPSVGTSIPPTDVFVIKADGTGERNLTQATADDSQPRWAPDGGHLAYETAAGGVARLAIFRMDGPSAVGSPTLGPTSDWHTWSPDGTHLLSAHVVVDNSSEPQLVHSVVQSLDVESLDLPTTLLAAPFGMTCAPSWQRLAP